MSVLSRLAEVRGLPEIITVNNGPEFNSKALDAWAYQKGVKLNYINPGKPIENAYIESFNGRFRYECLNINWFLSLKQARQIIESWREDYNQVRSHSSLDNLTPTEYANFSFSNIGWYYFGVRVTKPELVCVVFVLLACSVCANGGRYCTIGRTKIFELSFKI